MATPRSEPKQERARRTKSHILQSAAELFAERGYATVTLQDVAERAEMTKGAVYFHYTNKEALAVAVVQEHYARWPEILKGAEGSHAKPFDALAAVLDTVTQAFARDIVVQAGARLQIERALIDAELPEPYVGWEDYLTRLIAEARDAGELREEWNPARRPASWSPPSSACSTSRTSSAGARTSPSGTRNCGASSSTGSAADRPRVPAVRDRKTAWPPTDVGGHAVRVQRVRTVRTCCPR
ncbi:ScbR family autoregulator-binding transcription factor [Streptomyces diastatochromogenes]|nr:ScbR family autoregulator-binding transcription factor [Streptomyces diastatochromogenes]